MFNKSCISWKNLENVDLHPTCPHHTHCPDEKTDSQGCKQMSAWTRTRTQPPDSNLELSPCPVVCQAGEKGEAWIEARRREDLGLFYWALLPSAFLPPGATEGCPTLPCQPVEKTESPAHLLRLEQQREVPFPVWGSQNRRVWFHSLGLRPTRF